MQAIVVYESHWGNTATIAQAIAQGIGPQARALSTAEATDAIVADADLIVAGAPLLGFALPTEAMLEGLAKSADQNPTPPDLAHPSMRSWLDGLPRKNGYAASFETRIWWSPGSASKTILKKMEALGYQPIGKAQRFVVEGKYGPLREGEVERARAWGAELAQVLTAEKEL